MEPLCCSTVSLLSVVLQLLLMVSFASQTASAHTGDDSHSVTSEQYCGSQMLNETQICCQEKVLNVPSKSYRCCNTEDSKPQYYDPKKQMCSDNAIIKPLPNKPNKHLLGTAQQNKEIQKCGGKSFQPSKQMCCKGLTFDIPSEDAVCCGERAYRKDDNSNICILSCGNDKYNVEHQRCCGKMILDANTHDCCRDLIPVNKSAGFFCCNDMNVYHSDTMSCDENSGTVRLRNMSFNPADLCRESLVTWQARWPTFTSEGTITITGLIQSCDIKVRLKRNEAVIPLSPFLVTSGGQKVPLAAKVFKIRVSFGSKRCASLTRLRQYLKNKTLDIHTQNISFATMKKPELRIKQGHKSFILLRQPNFDKVLV